jgi:hypothetical protein
VLLQFHHVPGRLRVSLRALRRNAQAVVPLQEALLAIPGVKSASITLAIGSITIHYEKDRLELDDFWATLRNHGCLSGAPQVRPAVWERPADPVTLAIADTIGRAIISAMMQRLFGAPGGALTRLLI